MIIHLFQDLGLRGVVRFVRGRHTIAHEDYKHGKAVSPWHELDLSLTHLVAVNVLETGPYSVLDGLRDLLLNQPGCQRL